MRWALALRNGLIVLAAAHGVLFLYVVIQRVPWPYDLEWMEGGMLHQALRLQRGEPIYGPPDVSFVAFLYPPVYPAVIAALGKVLGLSYIVGRMVSLLSLVGTLVLGYLIARRAGAERVVAVAAMACVLAAFPFVGAWYDLARVDQLFLLLATAGIHLALARRTPAGAVASAALLVLAWFTKQTAAPFIAVAGLLWLLAGRRLAAVWAAAVALLWGAGVLGLQAATDGWFWAWCVRAPMKHGFYPTVAFGEAPLALLGQAPAVWAALVVALGVRLRARRLARAQLVCVGLGAVGAGLACVGFGKEWAFFNVFIPGVLFPLIALAALSSTEGRWRWLVPAALAIQLGTHFYDPRPLTPTARDRAAGDRLIALLASAPGEVLIPYHPWYAVLAGKPPHLHRMGLLDGEDGGFGRPRGLDEALAQGRFALVILNVRAVMKEWPTLRPRYQEAGQLILGENSPRTFAGADTHPLQLFRPGP